MHYKNQSPFSSPPNTGNSAGINIASSPPNNGTVRLSRGGKYSANKGMGPTKRVARTLRWHAKGVAAMTLFVAVVWFLTEDLVQDVVEGRRRRTFANFGGAVRSGYFPVTSSIISPQKWHWAAISDLDQMSLVPGSESKPKFYSILQPGTLSRNNDGTYEMEFLEDTRTLTGKHNEAGRGMELSELTSYENRLLSFDDRTGSIYELISNEDGKKTIVVPRLVVTEGDGDTDKGMKFEWATVKDGNLFVGSLGKEFTNLDGSIANLNNNWVAVVNPHGEVFRKDWTEKYNAVRSALGAERPGYLIHEAIEWSRHMRKWVFLPRRVSSEAYNDVSDERKGSNKIVIVDENFVSFEVVEVNFASKNPLHGFSSFKFIPGTKDRQIFALRSVEENCAGDDLNECKQWSYGAVFDLLTGKVLMEETRFPIDFKFEGVEFINIHIPSPMKRCKSLYI